MPAYLELKGKGSFGEILITFDNLENRGEKKREDTSFHENRKKQEGVELCPR